MEKPTVTEQPPSYNSAVPGPPPQAQPAGAPYPPPPPPPGYTPYAGAATYPPNTGYLPNHGATTNIITPALIIAVNPCPACRVGILEEGFTCLGILCAIFFFPFGILCCHALRKRRCTNCGAIFG